MTTTLTAPKTSVTTWNIDPVHSVAEFKVKHMMISNVKGQFTGVSGKLTLDETDIANSKIDATNEKPSAVKKSTLRATCFTGRVT